MKHLQKGFTLIELIVVIVILGILAATALPKFIDFKSDAATAAAAGVAGAISSASAINYAATSAGKSPVTWSPTTLSGKACTDLSGMISSDTSKYTLAGTLTCPDYKGSTGTGCTVQSKDSSGTLTGTAQNITLVCY